MFGIIRQFWAYKHDRGIQVLPLVHTSIMKAEIEGNENIKEVYGPFLEMSESGAYEAAVRHFNQQEKVDNDQKRK
jgi:hypothetical protein